jgi:hypothetical protein
MFNMIYLLFNLEDDDPSPMLEEAWEIVVMF